MSDLRPPATGTEAYLEAILEELRAIRVALEGGGQAVPEVSTPVHAGEWRVTAEDAAAASEKALTVASKPPVKRTRTRTPREGASRG